MSYVPTYNEFINENLEVKVSAGLAIVWNGQILLAHSTGRKFTTGYGIPKGGVEEGESLLDAAIRETYEEIGISVPRTMIDPTQYRFEVNARKWGYKKIVHYFICPIDSLDQIGLKSPKVKRSSLQLEEIDDARFIDLKEATNIIMPSQKPVLGNLMRLGLIQ